MSSAQFLAAARHAVTQASLVCRVVQKNLEQVKAVTKDDKSPVTVADFASQAIVAHVLTEQLGKVILVGEEESNSLREDSTLLAATLAAVQEVWPECTEESLVSSIDIGRGDTHHSGYWTLDPVDGTKGFLRNQQYAVALAYIERGVPTVGALGCPNLPMDFNASMDVPDPKGCIYLALRGDGVSEVPANDPSAHPRRITRLDHAKGEPIRVCASVESGHSNVDDTDRILAHIGESSSPIRLDSQAKYAVVARGQSDAYLRLPTKKGYVERIWDHAAGALVAVEAGCFVTDIHGNPLDFSHGRGLEKNKGVVCAPPRVHGLMIGAIRELGIGKA